MPKQKNEEQLVPVYLAKQKALEHWFQSALGRALLADQRDHIEDKIARVFGVHQAEIGISHRIPVGNPSNLAHKFYVLPQKEEEQPEDSVIALSHELPLAHDSVDLVILHHALDVAIDPHQTLREVSRILRSSGHLIIVGFNPYGLWGWRRFLGRARLRSPWDCRFIAGSRVEDWLQLLDFRVDALNYHFYRIPVNRPRVIRHFGWLEHLLNPSLPLGAYYVIHAQKQVVARIVTKPGWQRSANVVGMPLANRIKSNKLPHDSH